MTTSRQLSNQIIATTLAKFSVATTSTLCSAIREYIDLLLLWNQKLNLTSITSPLEILSRHFGESMFANYAIPDLHGRLADVGSGAGFPGLALKILRPDLEVFVIESVMKKATFLAEVTRHLNLAGVKVVVSRFEDLADNLAPLDFICARALGDRDALLSWAKYNVNTDGKVVLWLGSEDAYNLIGTAGRDPDVPKLGGMAARDARAAANSSPRPELRESHAAAKLPPTAERQHTPAPSTHSGASESLPDELPAAQSIAPGATRRDTIEVSSPAKDSISVTYNIINHLVIHSPANESAPRSPLTDPRQKDPVRSSWAWSLPVQIPESANRYLLIGQIVTDITPEP